MVSQHELGYSYCEVIILNSNSDEYRYVLSNQFKILSLLCELSGDSDGSKKYDVAYEGVILGYGDWAMAETPGYDGLDPLMEEKDKRFVLDVLGMYSFIYGTYDNLAEEEKNQLDVEDLRFIGFDGNASNGQYGFCEYLLNDLHRFPDVLDFIKKYSWDTNSHGFREHDLREMLTIYKEATNGSYRIDIKTATDLKKFIR